MNAMSELSLEEKCKLAAKLVEQSPPGEVNDVINDLRNIINDDEALMTHVRPSLRAYNLKQLTPVEHEAEGDVPAHTSILSEANILPGSTDSEERYVDASGKRSFAYDHITLTISDYQPYNLPEEEETFRAQLAQSLANYTKNHFSAGHSSVSCSQYPLVPAAPASSSQPVTEEPKPEVELSDAPEGKPTPETEAVKDDIVTDVVPEQVAAGDAEPVPTPVVGEPTILSAEEVDSAGGLEKLDEEVEKVKEDEEGAAQPSDEVEVSKAASQLKVEDGEVEVPAEASAASELSAPPTVEESTATAPPVDERKQERVENPTYTLEIVGNRYNPSNFWTGRWRAKWVADAAKGVVKGVINVDVHYYEQGNVQLATEHTTSFPYPSESTGGQSIASQIVTTISKVETDYHMELNDVYGELGDKAFRALRRALPVTRQKMDWDKVGGYSLGGDLTKARS